MNIDLLMTGLLAGILSGFFGVGGGTITVPMLIFLGLGIKPSIAISAFQMSFSSLFGSYINHKHAVFDAKEALPFLIGGGVGGIAGAHITGIASDKTLILIFLSLVVFTIIKLFFSPAESDPGNETKSKIAFILSGFLCGAAGSCVGIGGALLMTPVLVGFMHFGLKKAIGISLFFVISTSIFAAISFYINGLLDLHKALQVAIPSLLGVYVGIFMASKTNAKKHKGLLLALYVLLSVSLIYEYFWKQ